MVPTDRLGRMASPLTRFAVAAAVTMAIATHSTEAAAQAVDRNNFQTPTYDMQLWRPAIDSRGYVTVNSSRVLGHLDFSLGLVGTWAFQPLQLQTDAGTPYGGSGALVQTTRTFSVDHLITPQLLFALGLFKYVEIGIGVPVGIAIGKRQRCTGNTDECSGYDNMGTVDTDVWGLRNLEAKVRPTIKFVTDVFGLNLELGPAVVALAWPVRDLLRRAAAVVGHARGGRGELQRPIILGVAAVAAPFLLELLGILPPVYPEWLGDRTFLEDHGLRFPYMTGAMANGIATTRLVIEVARAGMLGFFGAAYYLVPEESEREIHSVKLAWLQLAIFVLGTAGVVVTYLFNLFDGNWLLGNEGREFIEQPKWVKAGIVVAALIFLYNISMTVLAGKKTAITNILLLGLWVLSLLFLFAFVNPDNLALDKMYWWYIVHLWVEGTWELVMASILAFLMLKLTGVDREIVEKWLYIIVATSLFSGILGTGHHYLWIGTPAYWQWTGTIFSMFEVAPFFAMMSFAFIMVWKGKKNHPNKAALLWSLGCSVVAFFGAGVWGLLHTVHGVNYYSHGTQVTAAHGHLAFYGAYVMLNLAMISYAMPVLRHHAPYNQVLNMASFWLMTSGMAFMTFTLTFAGVVQTHLQRVMGMTYMEVQDQLGLFYAMRFAAGFTVVVGALLFIYSQVVLRREVIKPGPVAVPGE